jgi:predicted nuclease of restriction endonuclease-like (RecB) superfamily
MSSMSKPSQKPAKAAATVPTGYGPSLAELKARVRAAQLRAATGVTRELNQLYWEIGSAIARAQETKGYGKQVVERLAADLQAEFPGMAGFSPQNVWFMRSFYLAWSGSATDSLTAVRESTPPDSLAVARVFPAGSPPEAVADLPWGHNRLLLTKLKQPAERLWYAQAALRHGWSRAVLTVQIETKAHRRMGKAQTNFAQTLPPPQSDLAQQVLKDPYTFDFLTLSAEARERELEQGLTEHIQKFLVELGVGFAFVGRQVHLEVGGEDYYLDLLFYHLKLRCFVVLDLKMEAFKPEFAGKMNFYLTAVDEQMRHANDQPTIGLLLCKEKNRLTVEYALRDVKKPIGVAEWKTRLVESLPKQLRGALPSVEVLERGLADDKP